MTPFLRHRLRRAALEAPPPSDTAINATTEKALPPTSVVSLAELLTEPHCVELTAFGASCNRFKLLSTQGINNDLVARLYSSSLNRMERLLAMKHRALTEGGASSEFNKRAMMQVSSNFISTSLINAIQVPNGTDLLADVLVGLAKAFEEYGTERKYEVTGAPLTLNDVIVDSGIFDDCDPANPMASNFHGKKPPLGAMLLAKLKRLVDDGTVEKERLSASHPSATTSTNPTPESEEEPDLTAGDGLDQLIPITDDEKDWGRITQIAESALKTTAVGPIAFIAAELGKWSTVGGLGVMVDDLTVTLANAYGQQVWVISPYYDRNRKGETDYLKADGIQHLMNLSVTVGVGPRREEERVELGVHEGMIKGVRVLFLHNSRFMPHPYPDFSAPDQMAFLTVFAKAALETLCQLRTVPQLVVTNDWSTGLVPAYAKEKFFGNVFDNTTFFHIVHNLDASYEGRIYPNDDLKQIHHLPPHYLVDPGWSQFMLNPSRCALLASDGWGTVSPSYRDDLRGTPHSRPLSSLAPLLNKHPNAFAYPNGIPVEERKNRLRRFGGHMEAKEALQRKYFGLNEPNGSIPLFAFIGRITSQKGVHLILDSVDNLVHRFDRKIQILVGGKANYRDPYSARCAQQMRELRNRHPQCFWAEPDEFFVDGPLVNLGADFGLMPSAFEPGGIVQHEFFIGGTPVLAFKTGGLKDTVFEFNAETEKGNGFLFEAYHLGDYLFAVERAIRLYGDGNKYLVLRKNAERSVVSCEEVAGAWLSEFCRLRRKLAANPEKVVSLALSLPPWSFEKWKLRRPEGKDVKSAFNAVAGDTHCETGKVTPHGTRVTQKHIGPILSGPPGAALHQPPGSSIFAWMASAGGQSTPPVETQPLPPKAKPTLSERIAQMAESAATVTQQSVVAGDRGIQTQPGGPQPSMELGGATMQAGHRGVLQPIKVIFTPDQQGRGRPRKVAVAGSFDDWRVRRPLTWDNALQSFSASFALTPGRYTYKLIVDGNWMCNPDCEIAKDHMGNENNVLNVK
eukprot:GHVN01069757.1.p1 GENE.GHVN01069757.1~~GHVN01069757.1.p1  ORF type:complete len:1141 (+),score=138.42 GHVN01069757.1:362-3424(+)